MNKTLLLLAVFITTFSSSFASNRVYTMGRTMAVVADDEEWICETTKSAVPSLNIPANDLHIEGKSINHPIRFVYYVPSSYHNMGGVLMGYALKTDSVLYNVEVVECSNSPLIIQVMQEDYFNNSSSGHFQAFYRYIDGTRYIMFSLIEEELFDEDYKRLLFDSSKSLATPLYSPKALTLWLESVEKEEVFKVE